MYFDTFRGNLHSNMKWKTSRKEIGKTHGNFRRNFRPSRICSPSDRALSLGFSIQICFLAQLGYGSTLSNEKDLFAMKVSPCLSVFFILKGVRQIRFVRTRQEARMLTCSHLISLS